MLPTLPTPQPLNLDPATAMAGWPDAQTGAGGSRGPGGPRGAGLTVLWSGQPGRHRVTLARPDAWIYPQNLVELAAAWQAAQAEGSLLAGILSYDLGRHLEPAAVGEPHPGRADSDWPLIAFARCSEWATFADGAWRGPLDVAAAQHGPDGAEKQTPAAADRSFTVGPLGSGTGPARYRRDVGWLLERIRAGDVYQVNLAHQLVGKFQGSARGLFAKLVAAADPWHGAYLELPAAADGGKRALCSISPELFMDYEPLGRRITTRPMKGTRPGAADPAELAAAAKDTAELNMIIDLMRNDLGRSCAPGSIRVEQARSIERHGAGPGGVLQATGAVSGTLAPEVSFLEALGRAFPPGSVTGAPKIQAMRMIDRLEPSARGPYCGSICELRPDGGAACSVAIRTAVIRENDTAGGGRPACPDWFEQGELTWSVGAGIVADSDPEAEWRETLDKAGILSAVTGAVIEGGDELR